MLFGQTKLYKLTCECHQGVKNHRIYRTVGVRTMFLTLGPKFFPLLSQFKYVYVQININIESTHIIPIYSVNSL